jgi:hypothetical protein
MHPHTFSAYFRTDAGSRKSGLKSARTCIVFVVRGRWPKGAQYPRQLRKGSVDLLHGVTCVVLGFEIDHHLAVQLLPH